MFDGPGGAVAVLNGPDGKFGCRHLWLRRPQAPRGFDALGQTRQCNTVIDTHWHFDPTVKRRHLPRRRSDSPRARKTLKKRMSERMIFRYCIEDRTAALAGRALRPSPRGGLPKPRLHGQFTSYKPNGETLGCNRCSAHNGFGILVHLKRLNGSRWVTCSSMACTLHRSR